MRVSNELRRVAAGIEKPERSRASSRRSPSRRPTRTRRARNIDADMMKDLGDAQKQLKDMKTIIERGEKRDLPGADDAKKAWETLLSKYREG